MNRIGIRELRQNATVYLRCVERGEKVEITSRGRPVAMLVPIPDEGAVQRLEKLGCLSEADGDLLELGPPLPAASGVPEPSRDLEERRRHER